MATISKIKLPNIAEPLEIKDASAIRNPNAALTGTPTAPTAPVGTDTTQIATTAFVQAAIGAIGGTIIDIYENYLLDTVPKDVVIQHTQSKVVVKSIDGLGTTDICFIEGGYVMYLTTDDTSITNNTIFIS